MAGVIETLRRRSEETASRMLIKSAGHQALKANRDAFEHQLRPFFQIAAERVTGLILSLRRTTFVITAASQDYAIARVLGQKTNARAAAKDHRAMRDKEMQLGGSVAGRVDLALSRLLRDVVDSFQMNQVMGGTPEECLDRISRVFPKIKLQKRPPKVMARLTEAHRPKIDVAGDDPWGDFITPEEWDAAVEDYLDEYVPLGRAPYDMVFNGEPGDEDFYARPQWAIEQELTDDFIDAVRDGESAAANAQGIDTFSWIAVIDGHTDTCCSSRDGLTVEEIEEGLDSGKVDSDESDATAAPAHFNCRCRMAPMTTDMPEESGPDWAEFDSWLTEKAKAT